MEKAPAEITGSFSMLFLMVLGRFPEKFSFGIYFSLQHNYRCNTIIHLQITVSQLTDSYPKHGFNGARLTNVC